MHRCAGVTLPELLVTLSLIAVALGFGSLYLTPMEAALESGLGLTQAFMREARVTAMGTTSAYRVKPGSGWTLIAETADTCTAASWTLDPDIETTLPSGVLFTDTTWTVCFTSGGKSTNSQLIDLWHAEFGTRQLEVLLGGTTRVVE